MEYRSYDMYERAADDFNSFPVMMLASNPDQSQGVPTFAPEYQMPVNLDPGVMEPPTNFNPTYRVTVEEPAYAPASAGFSIPWWLWLVGGYAAYKLLWRRK